MDILKFVLLILGGYLLGNFSSAKFLSKLKKDDITKHGSGNPGTMNMLRTFGLKAGILTLILDALKGAIPSMVGFLIFGGATGSLAYIALFAGGLSAVVGHVFPVFYKFKGGKGVACIFGMFMVAEPIWSLVAFAVCLIYLLIFKYGVLASFIFITTLTIIEGNRFRGNLYICLILFATFFLIWFMHRQNFFRLLIGKENKANLFKRKPKDERLKFKEKKQIKKQNKQKEIG